MHGNGFRMDVASVSVSWKKHRMNSEKSQLLQVRGDGGATLSIAYRFHEPEPERPVYVWFCGFGSEMGSLKAEEVARWTRDVVAGCLRFDYSGHGASGGRFRGWRNQRVA